MLDLSHYPSYKTARSLLSARARARARAAADRGVHRRFRALRRYLAIFAKKVPLARCKGHLLSTPRSAYCARAARAHRALPKRCVPRTSTHTAYLVKFAMRLQAPPCKHHLSSTPRSKGARAPRACTALCLALGHGRGRRVLSEICDVGASTTFRAHPGQKVRARRARAPRSA